MVGTRMWWQKSIGNIRQLGSLSSQNLGYADMPVISVNCMQKVHH
jgi:hypothetical protein